MSDFNFERLPGAIKSRIETLANVEGISISEAVESVLLEVIGTEALNRSLAKLDKDLEKQKPRLALVKTLDFAERY